MSKSETEPKPQAMTLGARLKRILAERNITQTEFARMTGIERTELNRTLNDKREPKGDEIAWMAQALKLSPEELLDGLVLPRAVERARAKLAQFTERVLEAEAERDAAMAQVAALQRQLREERASHASDLREAQARVEQVAADFQGRLRDAEARASAREAQLTKALQESRAQHKIVAVQATSYAAKNRILQDRLNRSQREIAKVRSEKVATGVVTGLAGMLLGSLGTSAALAEFEDED